MKIALVHDWLTGMRGGEKCLEVACRRFPGARLFTLIHRPSSTSPAIERMAITTSWLNRLPCAHRYYRYLLPLMPGAVERLRLPDDVDLVLSFSHAVAKSIQPPSGVPHVCYCFTPMRYAWHRRGDYFPQSATGQTGGPSWPPAALGDRLSAGLRDRLLDRLRDWDRRTAHRVTHFVAISRNIQQRISECYGRDSRLIYPPVDTDYFTPDPGTPRDDFYLHVGALVPYKRTDLAVAACNRLGRRLIVVGDGPELPRLRRLAGPNVTLLGRQSDEVVHELLRRCRALLFAANEDFGIVPLEAQACGAPVIALAQGGALETVRPCGESTPGSGWLFAEQSVESLAAAVTRSEAHARLFDPDLARRQAERFRAERFERELVGLVEEVAAERQPAAGRRGVEESRGRGIAAGEQKDTCTNGANRLKCPQRAISSVG